MSIHPAQLATIRRVADELREMLGDDYDPEVFQDTLEGETDVLDVLGALLKAEAEAAGWEAGAKETAAIYQRRAKAMADRQAAVRALMAKVMDATGEKTIRHPLATLTMKAGKPELIGESVTDLPESMVRVSVAPDKTAIRKALDAGETVPGWALGNCAPSLTVRRA